MVPLTTERKAGEVWDEGQDLGSGHIKFEGLF